MGIQEADRLVIVRPVAEQGMQEGDAGSCEPASAAVGAMPRAWCARDEGIGGSGTGLDPAPGPMPVRDPKRLHTERHRLQA